MCALGFRRLLPSARICSAATQNDQAAKPRGLSCRQRAPLPVRAVSPLHERSPKAMALPPAKNICRRTGLPTSADQVLLMSRIRWPPSSGVTDGLCGFLSCTHPAELENHGLERLDDSAQVLSPSRSKSTHRRGGLVELRRAAGLAHFRAALPQAHQGSASLRKIHTISPSDLVPAPTAGRKAFTQAYRR